MYLKLYSSALNKINNFFTWNIIKIDFKTFNLSFYRLFYSTWHFDVKIWLCKDMLYLVKLNFFRNFKITYLNSTFYVSLAAENILKMFLNPTKCPLMKGLKTFWKRFKNVFKMFLEFTIYTILSIINVYSSLARSKLYKFTPTLDPTS